MKANELRINNYIMTCKPEFLGKKDFVISKVSSEYIDYIDKNVLFCEPIPLTKEWLLKFGFEGFDLDIYTMCLTSNRFLILFDELEVAAKNIKYVHQLQNLYFALTNNELTIK